MKRRLVINKGLYDEFDEVVVVVDAWYDRHSRSWIIQKKNSQGFQIGDAILVGDKETKNIIVRELNEEFGL